MKIRLVNFRCYSDKTFDFGDEGMALISAASGQGKSTILFGIYFALFGVGTKLQTYGKTSCRVEMEFDGMKIVRTKRPNRLVVNDLYEDKAGQDIIDKKFGSTFDVTGYISQNALNSFIMMSPVDKLRFLERFAFQNTDLGKIKGRCKAVISKRNEELISVVSQLDMAKGILSELDQPNEVRFPIKCSVTNREKVVKREYVRYKNSVILLKRAQKKVKKLEKELQDILIYNASSQNQENAIADLRIKEEELDGKHIDYIGDKELEKYEKRLEKVISQRELIVIEKQYEEDRKKLLEMEEKEKKGIEEEISKMSKNLWKEYTSEELKETLKSCRDCLKDAERIHKLEVNMKRNKVDEKGLEEAKTNLETYTKELDEVRKRYSTLLMQKEMYSCPSCHAKLRMVDDELILSISEFNCEDLEQEIEEVQTEIKKYKALTSKLSQLVPELTQKKEQYDEFKEEYDSIKEAYSEELGSSESMQEDIDYLQEYQASQNELERKLKRYQAKLENNSFSTSYQTFFESVTKLETQIKELREASGEEKDLLTEEKLRDIIYREKQNKFEFQRLEQDKIDTTANIAKLQIKLHQSGRKIVDKYGEIRDQEELQHDINNIMSEIVDLEKKRDCYETNIELIKKWEAYNETMENYRNWEDKVEDLEKKEKEARNMYASATQLRDKILEAESLAMLHIVDSINTHTQLYLDCFFPDNPMVIRLLPFKETKKSTKPNINLAIDYKGMECDLNMLSGGELSRVILAFTLALAEMFNTPLLLLDECTASLDQEMTNTVFNSIREHFNGKITLVIAHQIITGTFDTVIKLGEE